MKKIKITELLIFIISTELVGALSGLVVGNSFSLYSEFSKPPFSPPGVVFPIVWAILYALMGISAYLIYTSNSPNKKKALTFYAVQLLFNFLWSIVFFKLEMPRLSVFVILILIAFIIIMIASFRKIRPISAYINLPYLLWTIFAAYLNIGVAVLN